MIIYFSATGNCKYVAKRLSEAMGQETVFIPDCMNRDGWAFEDEAIGIISPTYFWGLPSMVKEFLSRASFHTDYLFFVSTYGTTTGASGKMADRAIRGKKIDAYYSVRMADTWTPIFDLSTPEKVAKFTEKTEEEIGDLIEKVRNRYHNDRMSPGVPAAVVDLIAQPMYNAFVRKTSNLHVDDSCIGCGLCERKCPVKAIEMRNKKPVWVREKCVMCLGCLHRCPKFAIQYGNGMTKAHGQFTNPNVKV
ncbi:MAG: EFR1 family ferrodoxin [Clostridia bacterium]|nr:EFR1 family ferrodoxin [Clostridia bacterium]